MFKTAAFYPSPIGNISIECTNEFITAILFADQLNAVANEDTDTEESVKNNALINTCQHQLKEYFEGSRREFDLPFQQGGTAFQQKIWSALVQIPYGKTISYQELSRRTGEVKATRAVGTTNGKNQLSIVVPCHRVIGGNGDLTGYSGGLWRKKWLLEHEGKFANGVQTLF
jgi:methylated-DNA-[protein]-cysteine S-methyltransferase